MRKQLNDWLRRRRLLRLLNSQLNEAVGMMWWGRAFNICDRIDRVRGVAHRGRIASYLKSKQVMATACGWPGQWQFDRYTLT